MNLSSLHEVNETFWELDENKKQQLLGEILTYANESGIDKFENEVAVLFSLEEELSPLDRIYEALSNDSPKWGIFFKHEIIRGFELANKVKDSTTVFLNVSGTTFASSKEVDLQVRDEIVEYLVSQLDSENIRIVYEAICFLEDWIDGYVDRYVTSIKKIQECLLHEHWRVRYIAHSFLRYYDKVPKNYKPSIIDRIKISLLSNQNF